MLSVVASHNSGAEMKKSIRVEVSKLGLLPAQTLVMVDDEGWRESTSQTGWVLILRWVIAYSPPTLSYQTEDTLKQTLIMARVPSAPPTSSFLPDVFAPSYEFYPMRRLGQSAVIHPKSPPHKLSDG